MSEFGLPLLGGALIGISATLVLLSHGRIAGISGIIGGVLDPTTESSERRWRVVFLLGLLLGGLPFLLLMPARFELGVERAPALVVLAGLLVGWGTRLGSGCTSGHGVCGMSRLSPRSVVATLTFIVAGATTVALMRGVGL